MDVRFGIEHEVIVSRNDTAIDFRDLIHTLPIEGHRIDPVDQHAYRLPSGTLLTCDGPEAEVATPPIPLGLGFTTAARDHTAEAARTLRAVVPSEFSLIGGSTHISVSVPDELAAQAAGLFARTFAPAVMLLMDGPESPGMLVRPRYGRVEIGADYAARSTLAAALAMTIGGVLICRDVAAKKRRKSALPTPLRMKIEPATLRYGWYVDRAAFGLDLYTASRDTPLRRELFGKITVDEMLQSAWQAAAPGLDGRADAGDLAAVSAAISGVSALPTETGIDTRLDLGGESPPRHPLGQILDSVNRGRFVVEPVVAAWNFTVLRARGERDVFITVPAADATAFLAELNAGDLDTSLIQRLERPADDSTLSTFVGATRRAVYDNMVDPRHLATPERGAGGQLYVDVAPSVSPTDG